MLSRSAERMYRLGCHIELAENITRILDVNRQMGLGQKYFSDLDIWSPMLEATGSQGLYDRLYDEVTEANVCEFMLLNPENPESVLSCVRNAREDARTMRDRISEEMWLHLNGMYLTFQEVPKVRDIMARGADEFNHRILLFCNTFHGLADNTMVRAVSWNFLRLGRFYQRALMTLRILDIKHYIVSPKSDHSDQPLELHQWEALLRSVSGYEAYRRLFRARIIPARVLDLLVANPRFPRSVHYCLAQMQQAVGNLSQEGPRHQALHDEVARFLEDLQHGTMGDAALDQGLNNRVKALEARVQGIHRLITSSYFNLLTITAEDGIERRIAMQQQPQQQQAQL